MTSTVAEQADECGREVRQRERVYPRLIDNGRLKPDTADRKIATMRDAERTLRFLAQHAAGLRALCHFLLATAPGSPPEPTLDERAALLAHPGVSALLEQWPEAEVRVLGATPDLDATGGAQRELFDDPEQSDSEAA